MKNVIVKTHHNIDLPLSYVEREGAGLPIVFLHGSGFDHRVFENQFESETLKDRHLIALDLPGHGSSANADDPKAIYSYPGFANIVSKFLSVLSLPKVVLAGWSLGGQIALEMLDNCEHLAGVFAFGATPSPKGPLGLVRSMHIGKLMLLASKGAHTIDDALYFEGTCLNGFGNGKFIETLLNVDPAMRTNLTKSLLVGNRLSQRERFERSTIPICLLHGEQDELVRMNYLQTLKSDALYRDTVQFFDACGHAPFAEKPDAFDSLLQDFTSDVEAGRAMNNIVDLGEDKIAATG